MLISMIRSIDAAWETPYSQELWDFLHAKKTNTITASGAEFITFGPALPDEVDPRVAVLTVHVHDDDDASSKKRQLHWNLSVNQPPDTVPPDAVKEMDQKLGGRDGMTKLLERCIVGVPPIASFRLVASIPGAQYRCQILPRVIVVPGDHDIAGGLAETSRLEQLGYRFENSPYGLEEVAIIYDHEHDAYIVKVRAKRMLRFSSDHSSTWLPYADELTDLLIRGFFSHRGG